ncbi:hypothetical protein FG379_003224 [Cryptosporidium bovis]|uniref:uncharacterized protein n=1 Tax=Cryptosporidium bovis TaxID=310047 RepID=UPI00351A118C|nr:hypothetical protein FG379_003224 [Cryptosporidium bovis]
MSVFTNETEKEEPIIGKNCDSLNSEESSTIVLINEIEDEQLLNKKVRVAGIVKEVNIVSEEMIIHYELKNVRVSLGGSRLLGTLERGKIVEIIGKLTKRCEENEDEDAGENHSDKLIIDAEIIRIIDNMNLHLYQLSILLRRKVINDSKTHN